MSIQAMSLFWQTLREAPHAFVSLTGEEFHARPLKVFADVDTSHIWLVVPNRSAMARRMHLNDSAFIVVGNLDGTFSGKVFGSLVDRDDDVSRQRLLRNSHIRVSELRDCLIARFVPRQGEAWLGSGLHAAKLAFASGADHAQPTATVLPFDVAKHRTMSRMAE